MKPSLAWYQEHFRLMKVEFETRYGHADNELLVFWLESGPCRVTHMGVDSAGVTVCAEPGVNLYADWHKGDRFERMFEAMGWLTFFARMVPPQMRGDKYRAWEVTPPYIIVE